MLVVMAERQVVAEQQEAFGPVAQQVQQAADRGQILAVQFDHLERRPARQSFGVHRLDKARLSHPAGAPQ